MYIYIYVCMYIPALAPMYLYPRVRSSWFMDAHMHTENGEIKQHDA